MRKDEELVAESNYPEFERELERMLLDERGAISLSVQTNKVMTACVEVVKVLELYDKSGKMSREEFEEKYYEAKKAFEEIRKKRNEEEHKIDIGSEAATQKVKDILEDFWKEAVEGACDIVDRVAITAEDLEENKIEATEKRISGQINKYLDNAQTLLYDRFQVLLNEAAGAEVEKIEEYEGRFFKEVSLAHKEFSGNAEGEDSKKDNEDLFISSAANTGGVVLSAILANNMLGAAAGGIYTGYKEAGVKGALVGGISTMGGTLAAVSLISTVVGSAASAAFAWPILIGGGVIGALTGKLALGTIFGQGKEIPTIFWQSKEKRIVKFRDAYKEALRKSMREQKESCELEKALCKEVAGVFDVLRMSMNVETEQILRNTENALEELKKQKVESDILQEQQKERMAQIAEAVNEISGRTLKLNQELNMIMEA